MAKKKATRTIDATRIVVTVNFAGGIPDFTVRARRRGDSMGRFFRSERGCGQEDIDLLKEMLQKIADGYCVDEAVTLCVRGFSIMPDSECS